MGTLKKAFLVVLVSSIVHADVTISPAPVNTSLFVQNGSSLQSGTTFYISSGTVVTQFIEGNASNVVMDNNGNLTMSNLNSTPQNLYIYNNLAICQGSSTACPGSGTLNFYINGLYMGLYRGTSNPFVFYDAGTGDTDINNIFSSGYIRFMWGLNNTIANFDSTKDFNLVYGVTAASFTFTGGVDTPPDNKALCLVSGKFGHCTTIVGASGGCTCAVP